MIHISPFAPRTVLLAGLLSLLTTLPAAAFETSRWHADYAALKAALAATYANLDTQVRARKIDLAALDRETTLAIDRAENDVEAARALGEMLKVFADGHLRLLPPAPAAVPATATEPVPRKTCAELGYRAPRSRGVDGSRLHRFDALGTADDAHFPAGVLKLDGGRTLGMLRISLFGEDGYPGLCETVMAARAKAGATGGGTAGCDRTCAAEVWREVGGEMTRALVRQVRELARREVAAIVIDLTGNGGGSEWVEQAARVVASPGLASQRMGFIKHPHWVKRFDRRIAAIDTDLAATDLAEPLRTLLVAQRERLAALRAAAVAPCERSGIWRGEAACDLVMGGEHFTSGLLPARPKETLQSLKSAAVLFGPRGDPADDGAYRGRLAILIDGKTASAAEQFAAMLKDAGAATLIGEKTLGAGCGYTDGGVSVVLPNSGMRVRMPDCVRFRKDGGNEVLGLMPDIAVAPGRTDALMRALAAWVALA
ncbi:MAG: hypothetical protein JNM76_07500 [Betaproteobacteria bacterium]|nr:hypothetical protein [Betaproteobacteria bacterium]